MCYLSPSCPYINKRHQEKNICCLVVRCNIPLFGRLLQVDLSKYRTEHQPLSYSLEIGEAPAPYKPWLKHGCLKTFLDVGFRRTSRAQGDGRNLVQTNSCGNMEPGTWIINNPVYTSAGIIVAKNRVLLRSIFLWNFWEIHNNRWSWISREEPTHNELRLESVWPFCLWLLVTCFRCWKSALTTKDVQMKIDQCPVDIPWFLSQIRWFHHPFSSRSRILRIEGKWCWSSVKTPTPKWRLARCTPDLIGSYLWFWMDILHSFSTRIFGDLQGIPSFHLDVASATKNAGSKQTLLGGMTLKLTELRLHKNRWLNTCR